MYKCKLQELCQRKSWNLPEYNTIKDGPDHLPRFKAIAVVNGLDFETPAECSSAKEAQNSVAKVAYDHFNISTPPRGQQSPSALVQPVFPACSSPLAPMPHNVEPVPVSPIPSSLPLPPPEGSLHMYKNRLQQHAQKRYLSLPVYTCESKGPPHTRLFKSRVSFDGKSYETMEFFPTLKEAEHAVAMVACQMLQIDQSQEDGGLYKNLLQELAQKRGLLCPTYETVRWGLPHRSVFQSIVEVGSSTFHGDEAKNKKQAEMNAASVAYCALTESSLVTECSKASSSVECVVSDNLTQSSLPTETMKRDEFVANEETEINAKRIKRSPENETANLPAVLPPEVSICTTRASTCY
ncbi:double-stranded RNA-binding protein 1-like isoform X4 [Primulina tabacum]|uniref:double-stranded RNA-binding protein 1-like isoform X4 n=1 Tax=Primulina tabacum TaxID=48773 RepID=UPI003F591599